MSKDLNWDDDELALIKGFEDIAIYLNHQGHVVIPRREAMYEDGDSFISFPKKYADEVISALDLSNKPGPPQGTPKSTRNSVSFIFE